MKKVDEFEIYLGGLVIECRVGEQQWWARN